MRSATPVLLVFLAAAARPAGAQPSFFADQQVKVVGEIHYGERSEKLDYTPPPMYRALHFEGSPGDRVDIRVESINGLAMTVLADSRYRPIVANFGSRITTVLPPSPDPWPTRYFIIVQEERESPATFTVKLNKVGVELSHVEEYYACTMDAQCTAVVQAPCCSGGYLEAVNRSHIAEYKAANPCDPMSLLCPQNSVAESRMAVCNFATKRCEMVPPDGVPCGGSGTGVHQCPEGYACRFSLLKRVGGVCTRL